MGAMITHKGIVGQSEPQVREPDVFNKQVFLMLKRAGRTSVRLVRMRESVAAH
jgi:hypothetical protein